MRRCFARSPLLVLAAITGLSCSAAGDVAPTQEESASAPGSALWTDEGDAPEAEPVSAPRRVLLVVVDDMSAMSSPMYADDFPDLTFRSAPLPNVESICDGGVRFRQAWSAPSCTATRATLMTGRHGFRNGSIQLMGNAGDHLAVDEPTLPRLLTQARPTVKTASFGKYNLGHTEESGGARTPNDMGWSHYAGALDANVPDYYSWPRTVDGVTETSSTYATTQAVDDTIRWLDEQGADASWMVWLAFNAPHAPFHAPPAELHDQDLPWAESPDVSVTDPELVRPYYLAATQAMDSELGRLLRWMEQNGHGDTDIIFIADNGAPPEVVEAPMDPNRGKGTIFEGGVHVPFCVSGPSVAGSGRVEDHPVGAVDILATVLDLQGAPAPETLSDAVFDGQSLAPLLRDPSARLPRDWAYTEVGGVDSRYGAGQAVNASGEKLIRFTDSGVESLFDLELDPLEVVDFLAAVEEETDARSDRGEERGKDDEHGHDGDEQEPDASQSGDTLRRQETLGALIDSLTASAE